MSEWPSAPADRSWTPVDLSAVLDGTWNPPEPTIGKRSDGVGLFYPGKKHTISSESEAGKTWLALAAARDEIAAENHVVYVDFEDDSGPVVARLLAMGVDATSVDKFFHYIRPEAAIFSESNSGDVELVLDSYAPTLCIVDGITEAMTLHGLNPLDNFDVAKFGRMVPRLLGQTGAAVVSLDHVTKAKDSRGRYSIGGVHKLNALDGAAYVLENRRPFGVGIEGVSTIRVAKDRPGQIRKHSEPGGLEGMFWFADLTINNIVPSLGTTVTISAPVVRAPDAKPTILMTAISDELARHPDGLSQRTLEDVIQGKAITIRVALSHLKAEGHVTERSPHKLLRPYVDPAMGAD